MKFLSEVWIGDRVQWSEYTLIDTASATYEILYALGEGGVGSVYAAKITYIRPESLEGFTQRRLEVGTYVAIKQQTLSDQQTWDEVSILSALTNAPLGCAIASCLIDFAIRIATNTAILVIQLPNGAQDGLKITEQLQSLPRVAAVRDLRLNIIAKLFGAIAELHRLGIQHRDIKPENIIVAQSLTFDLEEMRNEWTQVVGQEVSVVFPPGTTNLQCYIDLRKNTPAELLETIDTEAEKDFVKAVVEGLVVKLIDFGLSAIDSQSKITDGYAAAVGTPRYIDPWLIACAGDISFYAPSSRRKKQLNERQIWQLVDIWSAGTTAYTLFWGEFLFPDTQSKTLLSKREKTILTHALSDLTPEFDEDEEPLLSVGLGSSLTSIKLFYGVLTRFGNKKLRSGRIRVSFPDELYPEDSDSIRPIAKLLAIQPRKREKDLEKVAEKLLKKI